MSREILVLLLNWAVKPGTTQPVIFSDCCTSDAAPLNSVLDVVYTLPSLTDQPRHAQAALIARMGQALARQFGDVQSVAFYCRLIWEAIGAPGGLQQLAAQLTRLQVDVVEWAALRRPGALLAARMRPA